MVSSGFTSPILSENPYGVALVGETADLRDAEHGRPFSGVAGFKLTRLLEWAGLDRRRFDLWNAIACCPKEPIEGHPIERASLEHCHRAYGLAAQSRSAVIVPMGNVALAAITGRKGILTARGYVDSMAGQHVLPTISPGFIQRGQAKYSAAFINDVQKAVALASGGMVFTPTNYLLDPSPLDALNWARGYRARLSEGVKIKLAYDIETPGKGDDEGSLDEDDDPTYHIHRIGFSYEAYAALSIPFESAYMAAIRLCLESPGEKVVWNAGFDNPRLAAAGVPVAGLIHDGMVAWHILHSDLPKGLAFVATFTCPWQPAWKHLSGARPAYYNATDADVELRSMDWIEGELRRAGLWSVYERDVIQLDPVLHAMSAAGMPVDAEKRLDRAITLARKQAETLAEMEAVIPREARRIEHVYKKPPADTTGLICERVFASVPSCSLCGHPRPTKPHFKTLKRPTAARPQNPCAGGQLVDMDCFADEWSRLAAFTPSRDQLMRYNDSQGRPTPTIYDKKQRKRKKTMNDKAIQGLIKRYPSDRLYPLVLTFRALDKLAGTYIGRPCE